jgi:hypothetical protein
MKVFRQSAFLSLTVVVGLLTSCNNRKTDKESSEAVTDTVARAPVEHACYRQVTGSDTTTVNLFINGSVVMGELAVLPAEKDRATGKFSGTLTNNTIVADWQRSGEGVTQTHEVNFTVKGDSLLWREGERVEKQGKWVLANPDKGYQYVLTKVDCR